uniref:Uncharacterized protein n=1 Tax=Anopheles dirus TaxID=7168 RepID=A0A182NKL2_9DIPT
MLYLEDAEADEEDGQNGRSDDHRGDRSDRSDINGEKEKLDEEHSLRDDGSPEPPNGEIVSILRKNGSLLQSQEISSSQQNFFRMLDQKIEEGPDYDSSSETEQALEEARLNALVQHWESASLTTSMCSSTSRSLQGTPVRQVPLRQPPLRPPFQQPLSAELLSQQQLLLKQQHHLHQQQQHQQQQHLQQQQQLILHQQQQLHGLQQQQHLQSAPGSVGQSQQQQQQQQQSILHPNLSIGMNSPKRIIGTGNAVSVGGMPLGGVDVGQPSQRQLLSQSIIHQNYGVIQPSQTTPQLRPSSGRTLPSPVQCLQMSYYQQQQQQQQNQQQQAHSLSQQFQQQQQSIPPQSYYNDILRHPMQVSGDEDTNSQCICEVRLTPRQIHLNFALIKCGEMRPYLQISLGEANRPIDTSLRMHKTTPFEDVCKFSSTHRAVHANGSRAPSHTGWPAQCSSRRVHAWELGAFVAAGKRTVL